jgi:hypothetical protein
VLYTRGSEKHAVSILALEIALPLDGAIVLACSFFKLYANPLACLEGCLAYKTDQCYAAVTQFNLLANGKRQAAHLRACDRFRLFLQHILDSEALRECSHKAPGVASDN